MKEFDFEKAEAGAKVITRDGRAVRVRCFDRKSDFPIVALITEQDGSESIGSYTDCGKPYTDSKVARPIDLFMAPVEETYWFSRFEVITREPIVSPLFADEDAVDKYMGLVARAECEYTTHSVTIVL